MMQEFKLNRKVTVAECPWLDRDFEQGETVVPFYGATYGCIGPRGAAYSLDGDNPFFELPADSVERTVS